MNKTKKFFALVLALMMAFTTLVLPAAAAPEDEGIMPLYEVLRCEICSSSSVCISEDRDYDYANPTLVENGCALMSGRHVHVWYGVTQVWQCTNCGHRMTITGRRYDCRPDTYYTSLTDIG